MAPSKSTIVLLVVSWIAGCFSDILLDNTEPSTTLGGASILFSNGELFQLADDFIVPAGSVWTVSTIGFNGFFIDATPNFNGFTLDIYSDNITTTATPGQLLNSFQIITSTKGDGSAIFNLPNIVMSAGRYWLCVSASMSSANPGWFVHYRNNSLSTQNGAGSKSRASAMYSSFPYEWVRNRINGQNISLDLSFIVVGTNSTAPPPSTTGIISPVGTLYTQNGTSSGNVIQSGYWFQSSSLYKVADEFNVPSEGWTVTSVQYYGGFFGDSLARLRASNYTCDIYSNDAQVSEPGNVVYSYTGTPTPPINTSSAFYSLTFPSGVYLSSGRYWLTCYMGLMLSDISLSGWGAVMMDSTVSIGESAKISLNRTGWIGAGELNQRQLNIMFGLYGSIGTSPTTGRVTSGSSTTSRATTGSTTRYATSRSVTSSPMLATSADGTSGVGTSAAGTSGAGTSAAGTSGAGTSSPLSTSAASTSDSPSLTTDSVTSSQVSTSASMEITSNDATSGLASTSAFTSSVSTTSLVTSGGLSALTSQPSQTTGSSSSSSSSSSSTSSVSITSGLSQVTTLSSPVITTGQVVSNILYSQIGATARDSYDSTSWSKVNFNQKTGVSLQVADDFVVPSPGWKMNSLQVFGQFFPSRPSFSSCVWTIEIYTNTSGPWIPTGGAPTILPLFSSNFTNDCSSNPVFNFPDDDNEFAPGSYWFSVFLNVDSSSTSFGWSVATLSGQTRFSSWRILDSTGYFLGSSNKLTWLAADYFGISDGFDLQFQITGSSYNVPVASTTQSEEDNTSGSSYMRIISITIILVIFSVL